MKTSDVSLGYFMEDHLQSLNKNLISDKTMEHKPLSANGFRVELTLQTIFGALNDINVIQIPQNGYGKGSFVILKAVKI